MHLRRQTYHHLVHQPVEQSCNRKITIGRGNWSSCHYTLLEYPSRVQYIAHTRRSANGCAWHTPPNGPHFCALNKQANDSPQDVYEIQPQKVMSFETNCMSQQKWEEGKAGKRALQPMAVRSGPPSGRTLDQRLNCISPVMANPPPHTAQNRTRRCRKDRRLASTRTWMGDRSYIRQTAGTLMSPWELLVQYSVTEYWLVRMALPACTRNDSVP